MITGVLGRPRDEAERDGSEGCSSNQVLPRHARGHLLLDDWEVLSPMSRLVCPFLLRIRTAEGSRSR